MNTIDNIISLSHALCAFDSPPPPPLPWSDISVRSTSFRGLKQFIKCFLPQHLFDRIWLIKKRLKKSALKPHKLLRFEVPICEHCNLNCKGCGAFSPLVKEHCIDTEEYERDCARLSLLCGGIVEYVDLLGGEPLLHPEILKIIEITRASFNGAINIITNGIKLLSMPEEFWLSCKKNDVTIVISGYPIRLDHEKIKQTAGGYGVNLEIRGFGRKLTIWNKFPLDLDGSQNPINNFLSCFPSNFCLHLEHGKIATCAQPFVVRHFNTYFNRNIAVSEDDFIDIYKTSSLDEILLFLSRPIPFCKYCGIKKIKRGIKWDISKKEISEWV